MACGRVGFTPAILMAGLCVGACTASPPLARAHAHLDPDRVRVAELHRDQLAIMQRWMDRLEPTPHDVGARAVKVERELRALMVRLTGIPETEKERFNAAAHRLLREIAAECDPGLAAILRVVDMPRKARAAAMREPEMEAFTRALEDRERRRVGSDRLGRIQQALESYRRERGRYPTEGEGIAILLGDARRPATPPVSVPTDLLDGWERPFSYTCAAAGYRLCSNGRDGKPDTADDTEARPVAPALASAAARDPMGQWAFAVRAADGTAPRAATAARATTVTIAVDCVCARDANGRATRIESRETSFNFAEGTVVSSIAGYFANDLRERLAGLAITVDYEPGLESVFLGGADLAGIAAGSEDDTVIEVNMSCEVGPPEGRRLTVGALKGSGR